MPAAPQVLTRLLVVNYIIKIPPPLLLPAQFPPSPSTPGCIVAPLSPPLDLPSHQSLWYWCELICHVQLRC